MAQEQSEDLAVASKHSVTPGSKKRKSSGRSSQPAHSLTFRRLPWTYLRLILLGPDAAPVTNIDEIITRSHLTSALEQFLGLTGTAIACDILKISDDGEIYVRIPREDSRAVVEALSGWVGSGGRSAWRVKGRAEWLGALRDDGKDLFEV